MSVQAAAEAAAALADLTSELHTAPDLDAVLKRTVEFASGVNGWDCAAIVLRPGYGVEQRRVAGSDSRAAEAERSQQEHGEGPSESAARSDLMVVRDVSADPPWIRWGPWISARFGFHSVLSVGMRHRNHDLGVLNLYSSRRDAFHPPDQLLARALAIHTAIGIAAVTTCDTLQRALEAHTEVGQAVGILMERFDIASDEAMTLLRRHSQEHNIKLRAVAAEMVARRRGPLGSARGRQVF